MLRNSNLEGKILVTLQDHSILWDSFPYDSHITKLEDIIISICRIYTNTHTIDVISISEIKKDVLRYPIVGFAYDERMH